MPSGDLWFALLELSHVDPMIHRVLALQDRHGWCREHTAMVLAYALLQSLTETRQSFSDWISAHPRPVTVPLDAIAHDLMFNPPKGCCSHTKENAVNREMNRETVYALIDGERDPPDRKWGDIEDHPHELGSWILIMESLLEDARKAYQCANGDRKALDEIRKVVAVGVACMEQHGAPRRQ